MYIGILGGAFNPVHAGHMRLALEALEMTRLPGMAGGAPGLDRVDMTPCSQPPHKPMRGLLPFDLRLDLARAAVESTEGLTVSDVEGRRPGPSYTWDTLKVYRREHPDARLLFMVGGEDFTALAGWRRGLELPRLADIAMVPRADAGQAEFRRGVRLHWPEARLIEDSPQPYAELPWGARLLYLPLPRLDISASAIRQRWLEGRSVRFLMPDAALDILTERRPFVDACWREGARQNCPSLSGSICGT